MAADTPPSPPASAVARRGVTLTASPLDIFCTDALLSRPSHPHASPPLFPRPCHRLRDAVLVCVPFILPTEEFSFSFSHQSFVRPWATGFHAVEEFCIVPAAPRRPLTRPSDSRPSLSAPGPSLIPYTVLRVNLPCASRTRDPMSRPTPPPRPRHRIVVP